MFAQSSARPRGDRFDGWGGWLVDYPEVFVPVETTVRTGSGFQLWKVDRAMLEQVLAECAGTSGGSLESDSRGPPRERGNRVGRGEP